MDYCTLYIVRHGESESNRMRVMGGHTDADLTDIGRIEAETRSKDFRTIHFDAVYSSDLARAQQTAEIITMERNLAIKTREALRERNFGIYDGKSYEHYHESIADSLKQFQKLTDEQKRLYRHHPSIETDDEITHRFITVLREIAVAHPGQHVLVASHGSIMTAFLVHLDNHSFPAGTPNIFKNTGYMILRSDGVDFFLDKLVDTYEDTDE